MFLTRKHLQVDIFLTRRLSKALAFCEFASVNFEPCLQQQQFNSLGLWGLETFYDYSLTSPKPESVHGRLRECPLTSEKYRVCMRVKTGFQTRWP